MESLFEFLFKFPPLFYERGELVLSASWPVRMVVLAAAVLAAGALITYLPRRGRAGPLDRGVLAGLRLAVLAVLVLCLLQPALALTSTLPERNFVGVLLDDSRSMTIADERGERPRSSFVRDELGAPDAPLRSALDERFSVRFFRFGEDASRVDEPGSLTFSASDTRLAAGLDVVREELRGVPLAGVVVVSDGGGPADDELRDALLRLRAADVPVYAVGTGSETPAPDVEVSRVEMPGRTLLGSTVAVDVVLAHRGYGGRSVPLRIEEEGRRVAERSVELPGDGTPATARLHVRAETPGPRRFRVFVPPVDGEIVTRNNQRELLTPVEEGRQKILYVEGRPRFEVGFLRRAVEDDDLLQVVVLQRTAEEKFLRLSVDDADELAGGFPTSREELFGYRALILGSVEAGFFSPDQLRMIAEFVGERGGSLLMLGGRDAFAEGGYAGTPVADALPVVLDGTRPLGGRSFFAELEVRPTAAGRSHAALQLGEPGEAAGEGAWASLPPLSSLNPVRDVKAGATPLLVGSDVEAGDERVVLAWQRYGSGKALALPVQDTWMWQMHADVAVDDPTHATFWRQLLRWMVDGVPDRVSVRAGPDAIEPGRPAELSVEVGDSTFLGVNDARVTALVRGPEGNDQEIALAWSGEEDGVYRGRFNPDASGIHRVEARVEREDGDPQTATTWVRAAESDREYFDAGLKADLLRRVTRETGGRFYTTGDASRLARDLQYTGSGVTVVEERDLWDMPALFLLVVLLAGAEWSYRRWRGLA